MYTISSTRSSVVALVALTMAAFSAQQSGMAQSKTGARGGDQMNVVKIAHPDGPIVVLGASYAQGWDVRAIAGRPVVNRGITGQQSFELLERFDRDVVATAPRAVVIWGLINDIFRAPVDVEPALARIHDSYTRMIAAARQHGIVPILATEVTMGPIDSWSETAMSWIGWALGKESYQQRINRHVQSANRVLLELGQAENVPVLDFQRALSDGQELRRREFTQADGSHITAAGYAALTTFATPFLEKHVAR
jgi:lysophospholipase L1-like esterase